MNLSEALNPGLGWVGRRLFSFCFKIAVKNVLVIVQACSVKMSINLQKKNEANIQPS